MNNCVNISLFLVIYCGSSKLNYLSEESRALSVLISRVRTLAIVESSSSQPVDARASFARLFSCAASSFLSTINVSLE